MRQTAKPVQIRKVARVRDKATGNYFEVIEFPVSDTERVRIEPPPSVVVDPGAFERRLRDAGAILPKKDVRDFLKAVAGRKAPTELTYEARTGWTDDRKLFVLNDGVIGRSKDRILGVNQGSAAGDASGRLSTAGTWQSWRSTVGKAARSSSILMCGACTAFAAVPRTDIPRPVWTGHEPHGASAKCKMFYGLTGIAIQLGSNSPRGHEPEHSFLYVCRRRKTRLCGQVEDAYHDAITFD
jgi:hypothetical protein